MQKIIAFLVVITLINMSTGAFSFAAEKKDFSRAEGEVTLVNVNTASDTALRALPGIGESNSQRIIAGRPYTSKEQLKARKIISEAAYNKIKHRITVGQRTD